MSLFLIAFGFITFYLDGFYFNNYFKYIQMFFFTLMLLYLLLNVVYNLEAINIISYVNDNNDIYLHGHVSVDKETGKAIGQGIANIGSNIGIAATVGGVTAGMAKVMVKSSIPPLQKAAVVGAGALLGGINVVTSYLNKNLPNTFTLSNTSNDSINKFLPDFDLSPLQGVLLGIDIIHYAFIALMYVLIIQLIFKLYFKDNINLNLSNVLGYNFNTNLEYYLNKIIVLNKKMSVF